MAGQFVPPSVTDARLRQPGAPVPAPLGTNSNNGFRSAQISVADGAGNNLPHGLLSDRSILASQKILRQHGYNVTPDGINGPQTVTAWKAFNKGINPRDWNKAWTAHHQSLPSHTVAPHDVAPGLVPAPAVPTPGRTPAAAAPTPSPFDQLIDPESLARSTANEQYNPQISTLARQIADARAQQGATQGNIKDWYAKLVGDSNAAAGADSRDAATILGGHDSAAAGLVNALGGSASGAAADAGAQAGIGRTALEGLGLTNSATARNLGAAYAGEGVTALRDQSRGFQNDLKLALAQQVDLQGAKGSAYTKAFQDALGARTAQAKTQMDTQVEGKLSGVQAAQAAANLKGTQISNNVNQWRLEQGIKAANDGGSGSVPEFTKQTPGQLNQLQNNLLNGTLGPKGNLNQNPKDVFTKISSQMSNLSYGKWDPATNPAARAYVTNLIAPRLAAWNRQNPQNQYKLVKGQIVHTS